jgi:murein DD-endopeptidase MepM/ murein hydrolase activator NlpD
MTNIVIKIFYLALILLCACQQISEKRIKQLCFCKLENSSGIEGYSINQVFYPIGGGKYGAAGAFYGEGLHPGIDYDMPIGTYIVAVSDGIVVFVGEPYKDQVYGGGYAVLLKHADDFFSAYVHLSEVFVTNDQNIIRGQLIGLSGQSNTDYPHLHFGLIKNSKRGSGKYLSQTYNPNDFWLGGEPQCFNPNKDYSKYSFKEITFPVACSE